MMLLDEPMAGMGHEDIDRISALTHVFERGQVRKHRRDLERAHEAEPRDVRRPHRGDVAAVERDSPRGRRDEFGQHVEAGRFAGAVRADQGVDRSALDAQRHVADGAEIAEALAAFYGPGTGLFDGAVVDQLRRRRIPVIGDGGGWWSFLDVDDAAEATALAVERGASGVYNIVDDEPAPVREWLPELARMLGAKPPFTIPRWLMVVMMTESRAGSNRKARNGLGWAPAHPSWRQGFAEVLDSAFG